MQRHHSRQTKEAIERKGLLSAQSDLSFELWLSENWRKRPCHFSLVKGPKVKLTAGMKKRWWKRVSLPLFHLNDFVPVQPAHLQLAVEVSHREGDQLLVRDPALKQNKQWTQLKVGWNFDHWNNRESLDASDKAVRQAILRFSFFLGRFLKLCENGLGKGLLE